MKFTCKRCNKELDYAQYGGFVVNDNKDLCSKCWTEYIEIRTRHYQELNNWWVK